MNVRACLLIALVLVPVATHPASAAGARAPAADRRHGARDRGNVINGPAVKLERPAPASGGGTASVNGTGMRAATHANINGTRIRSLTPSLNGTSIGARR